MTKILLHCITDADKIATELQNISNSDLRVTSSEGLNENFDADIIVSAYPHSALQSTKIIRVLTLSSELLDDALTSDDIIFEPFSAKELYARIMRLIAPENRVFQHKGLKIEYKYTRVSFNDVNISLTLYEYKLLSLLAQKHRTLVSYNEILHALWDNPIGSEMLSIRVFINAIRKKLALAGANDDLIRTHAGKGYELT